MTIKGAHGTMKNSSIHEKAAFFVGQFVSQINHMLKFKQTNFQLCGNILRIPGTRLHASKGLSTGAEFGGDQCFACLP